jgi:hypothetical protein
MRKVTRLRAVKQAKAAPTQKIMRSIEILSRQRLGITSFFKLQRTVDNPQNGIFQGGLIRSSE